MFTGLVRERGRVLSTEGGAQGVRLSLEAPVVGQRAGIGDSVAVDGVCLTVAGVQGSELAFDVVAETLRRSTLGSLLAGAAVNLEPAIRAGEPLGGHFVQGHVDGLGLVRALEPEGTGRRLVIAAAPEVLRYCVEKGSIAVAGVSLTIAGLDETAFAVALVPHTLAATTLGELRPNDRVNLEVDVLAKYVERLAAAPRPTTI